MDLRKFDDRPHPVELKEQNIVSFIGGLIVGALVSFWASGWALVVMTIGFSFTSASRRLLKPRIWSLGVGLWMAAFVGLLLRAGEVEWQSAIGQRLFVALLLFAGGFLPGLLVRKSTFSVQSVPSLSELLGDLAKQTGVVLGIAGSLATYIFGFSIGKKVIGDGVALITVLAVPVVLGLAASFWGLEAETTGTAADKAAPSGSKV